jgi:cardiolipin synthase (CMP-forming)
VATESRQGLGLAGLFSDGRVVTVPNAMSLVRLACIPLFLWLLFAQDDRVAAAFLLGGLGATDWIDGYIARRYDQVSELGKVLDPAADRLLFIVGIAAIIIDGSAPLWFCWAVVVREVVVGATMVICTLVFDMERFDVTYWGKLATFLLMFAFPGFMLGATDFPAHQFFLAVAWIMGIPGLVLSLYTAIAYVPMIRSHLHARHAIDTPIDETDRGLG